MNRTRFFLCCFLIGFSFLLSVPPANAQLLRFDGNPVRMLFEPSSQQVDFDQGPGQRLDIPIVLEFESNGEIRTGTVLVIAGGTGFTLPGSEEAPDEYAYLPSMAVVGAIERDLDVFGDENGTTEEAFTLNIGQREWGYLYAQLRFDDVGGMTQTASTIIYFASSDYRVVFRYDGLERIVELFQGRQGLSPNEIRRQRERGAFSRIRPELLVEPDPKDDNSTGPQQPVLEMVLEDGLNLTVHYLGASDGCPAPVSAALCRGNELAVSGKVEFQIGAKRPVTNSIVEVRNEASGDQCVAQTLTNDEGRFLFCLEPDDTASLAVRALASGPNATVIACTQEDDTGADCDQLDLNSEHVFAVRSQPFDGGFPVPVSVDLPNEDHATMKAVPAMAVFQAVNLAHGAFKSRGLQVAPTGRVPAVVHVAFGDTHVGTSAPVWIPVAGKAEVNIEVSLDDVEDWDVILHEYGHWIQQHGDLLDLVDGEHYFNVNLCNGVLDTGGIYNATNYEKDYGTRLAWGEAWATWFSTWIQQFMRHRLDPPIESVGDLKYENYVFLEGRHAYDLEKEKWYIGDAFESSDTEWWGEGNEVAIQRFLWDVGDDASSDETDKLAAGHQKVWQLTAANRPLRLSGFVAAFQGSASPADTLAVGELLAGQGMSPTAKEGGSLDWLFGTRELAWSHQFGCAGDGEGTKSGITIIDNEQDQVLGTIGEMNDTNRYEVGSSQRDDLLGDNSSALWTVAGTDVSAPATGPYPGTAGTIYKTAWLWLILIAIFVVLILLLLIRWAR